MNTNILLVRHGQTETNAEKRLHKDKDLKRLNNEGIGQMKATGEKINNLKPRAIYSSKEQRAIHSAEIISEACNIPVQSVDGLQERNWGDFSGKTWPEIAKVLDKMSLYKRYNYVPPNGESWKEFDTRLKARLDNIVSNNKEGVVVIVTHGGAIRALMPYLLNVPKEESFKYDPDNASITMFEFDGKSYTKKTYNDTSHLD